MLILQVSTYAFMYVLLVQNYEGYSAVIATDISADLSYQTLVLHN